MLLRILVSAALASLVFAADVVLLTLFLNPEVELRREAVALGVSLLLPYSAAGTVALALLALAGSALRFWPRIPRSPIPALPWFTTLMLVATSGAAVLLWLNHDSYRDSIPEEFRRGLAGAAAAATGAAVVLGAVGLHALLLPRRTRAGSAALVVLAPAVALIAPLALRPPAPRAPAPFPVATETVRPLRRIILMGIDGLGPAQIREGVSRDLFAGFAYVMKKGAAGSLTTLRPAEAPPVWATIFTGRLPRDHGVKSFSTYRLSGSDTVYELLPKWALVRLLERGGLVSTRPVSPASRRRRTLWNALNAFGIPTGIVRVWGTQPPEQVQGFMLSHYFHVLRDDPERAAESLHPPDLLPEVRARAVGPAEVDRSLVAQFLEPPAATDAQAARLRRELVESALAPDLTYKRAGEVLRAAYDPPFFATYFYGLDVVGHSFTRFAQADRFGDVRPEEVRHYGRVLDRYAELLSQWVGEAARGLGPGEVLFVVSGYGMEPVPLWRRVADGLIGREGPSGTHATAPDGFVMAMGDGVRAGAATRGASVLDIAPTLLYLAGLPVARDMEGRVLTEILEEDFARAHPVTFVPSYESLAAVTPLTGEATGEDLPPLPEEGS
jgi:predicted AlkP superfamily phosphohydrolase/phosphomutase